MSKARLATLGVVPALLRQPSARPRPRRCASSRRAELAVHAAELARHRGWRSRRQRVLPRRAFTPSASDVGRAVYGYPPHWSSDSPTSASTLPTHIALARDFDMEQRVGRHRREARLA